MSFLLQILTHLLLDLQKLSWFYIILAKKFKVSYNFKKILHTFQHCQKYWYFLFLCLCASYSQVNIIELFKSTFDGDDSAKFNCKKDELYLTNCIWLTWKGVWSISPYQKNRNACKETGKFKHLKGNLMPRCARQWWRSAGV